MHINGRQNIDELLSRMEVLRSRLDDDARAAQQSVQEMTDWRHLVRRSPLATIAAAAVAGYLLVPKRAPQQQLTAEQIKQLSNAKTVILTQEVAAKPGLLGAFAAIAGAVLTRAATSFVTEKVSQFAAQHQNGSRSS
jgi:hypothetical protein